MPAQLRFLEHGNSVAMDLEPPTAGRKQLDGRCRIDRPKLGRQTGGPRFVVSDRAILDGDLHVACREMPGRRPDAFSKY
jgi:hypothetical protein